MGTVTLLWGFATRKKHFQLPQTLPSPMAGEKTHVLPPICAWSIPKFPRWLLGFSQPKPPVRNQRLPPKHRVKGVICPN